MFDLDAFGHLGALPFSRRSVALAAGDGGGWKMGRAAKLPGAQGLRGGLRRLRAQSLGHGSASEALPRFENPCRPGRQGPSACMRTKQRFAMPDLQRKQRRDKKLRAIIKKSCKTPGNL
ncbi:MAG: hypothetical protein Q4A97_00545 [Comamonadaceae bacterium]|nr:hypothetical protein [Comamonadaceae bacterium]